MAGPARTRRAAGVGAKRGGGKSAAAAAPVVALLCVAVAVAGCAGAAAKPPAHRTSHPASAGVGGLATGAQRRALAARYLVIANVGNHRLDVELGHLHGRDRNNLAAARRDLLQVATTERTFDQQLLEIAFPAATERIAQFLFWVNQSRASLTAAAASAPSLASLRADERRMTLANVPVEQAVTIIRRQLGLPPPSES